jgi:HK97 family phage major capsid protein
MKTLKELLAKRAKKIKNQRELIDAAKKEERNLTEEEAKKFDELEDEIKALDEKIETVKAQDEREQKLAQREKELGDPAQHQFRPAGAIPGETGKEKLDNGGFKNIGEFIDAIRFGDSEGRLNSVKKDDNGAYEVPDAFKGKLLARIRNEWTMGTGSEGGFAVPEQYQQGILMMSPGVEIIRQRATVIPAGDPPDGKITIPAFHQGADGVWGGVEVYWTEEGGEKKETEGKLRDVSLEPHEVSALTVVTDKLLRNWQAANTFITFLLRGAMMATEDQVFIKGNGVGKPIGVINGKGAMAVNRDTANEIKYIDVVKMLAKLPPESQSNAMWIANQSAMPQLMTLQDAAGNYIFIRGDATRGIPDTLAGIPIRFTGKTYPLGTKGDLILVDLQYYLIKDGSGPFIRASEHVYFKNNKTVIKAFWNVDGKGWVDEPLTLEDGSTQVSPYVVLDVPAA